MLFWLIRCAGRRRPQRFDRDETFALRSVRQFLRQCFRQVISSEAQGEHHRHEHGPRAIRGEGRLDARFDDRKRFRSDGDERRARFGGGAEIRIQRAGERRRGGERGPADAPERGGGRGADLVVIVAHRAVEHGHRFRSGRAERLGRGSANLGDAAVQHLRRRVAHDCVIGGVTAACVPSIRSVRARSAGGAAASSTRSTA